MLIASASFAAGTPKYVFYFIGDGMGPAQRHSAQYFYNIETKNPEAKLLMNSFPTSALLTTHSNNTMITDSAAGGTALATGFKITSGLVSKLTDGTKSKPSPRRQGMPVMPWDWPPRPASPMPPPPPFLPTT